MTGIATALALRRSASNGNLQPAEDEAGHRHASRGIDIDLIQPTKKDSSTEEQLDDLFIDYYFPRNLCFLPPPSVN